MSLKISEKGGVHDLRADAASNAVSNLKTKPQFVREITRLWGEANQKFLAIGRHLIEAKQKLPHGEYQAMVNRELPFGTSTARQIVLATQGYDSGMFPKDRLPNSYSVTYLLTTLSDEERETAYKQGLIRPDVRRSEVMAFKQSLAASKVGEGERLRAEMEKLIAEEKRIKARLAELRSQIGGDVIDGTAEEVE